MAYMCADSGNLMAIAQQVIQQKQQQQQQQQQMAASLSTTSAAAPPWGSHYQHPIADHHFPFVLPDPVFPDPFAAAAADHHAFPPAPFRLSDFASSSVSVDFESDEWMESLIGDSPAESSDMMSDLPPLFSNTAAAAAFVSSEPAARAIFSESHNVSAVPFPDPPLLSQIQPSAPPPPRKEGRQAAPEAATSPPLLKSLLDCAQFLDSDPDLAAKSLLRIQEKASDTGDPTQRVAFYFAEALSHRLASAPRPLLPSMTAGELAVCCKALNEACPYFKFAHLTANQAILESTESASKIHIVDFGIVQGVQWPALLQALATRRSGKPSRVRISGIPAPAVSDSSLATAGNRLRDFAALLDLDFEFEPVRELTESSIRVEPGEAVAVNFMLQLHHLLDETPDAVRRALRAAKALGPRVVTLGEYEARLNVARYGERFASAVEHFTAAFESIEAAMGRGSAERAMVERLLLRPRILGAVGPDGWKRVRTEGSEWWRDQMDGCGLEPVSLSNYAVSQAKILLWNYDYSSKYRLLDHAPGFLSLAWEDRAVITVSSWR